MVVQSCTYPIEVYVFEVKSVNVAREKAVIALGH